MENSKILSRSFNLIIASGFVVISLILLGVIFVASYVSAYNTGNLMEKTIKATYSNNQNILTQYSQKVMEAAQIPAMARDDIVITTRIAIEGRYGQDGSKALFQVIREKNPTVDPALYRQIQQIIEAGRNEFQTAQTRLIDQKRVYEVALGSFWKGTWMRFAGYPTISLDEYKIIATERTENIFRSGKESGPIIIRSDSDSK